MIFKKVNLVLLILMLTFTLFAMVGIVDVVAVENINSENNLIVQASPDNWPGRSSNWGLNTTAQRSGLTTGEEPQPFARMIGRVINPILGLVGSLFVVLIVYAGVTWMTAGGNEEKITKAKKIIYSAAVGLIVTVFAYAIAFFVAQNLTKAQTATTPQQNQNNNP